MTDSDLNSILAQESPLVMVDKVLELEKGKRVRAVKSLSSSESYFKGHFPGNPTLPGVLIVEAVYQAALLIFFLPNERKEGGNGPIFIQRFRFLQPIAPGDSLEIEVEVIEDERERAKVKGVVKVDGKKVSQGTLVINKE